MSSSNSSLKSSPPRALSFLMRLQLLLSGARFQLGSAFFWIGMISVIIFGGQSELRYLLSFDGDWIHTDGVVQGVSSTGNSVNEQRIYEYTFTFAVEERAYEAKSYGPYVEELDGDDILVPVEYKAGNTGRARIVGQSTSVFPVFVALTLIFPMTGLWMMISGIRLNYQSIQLLTHGHATRGTVSNCWRTGSRINEEDVYGYTFDFTVQDRSYTSTCRTHRTELVEDEEREMILYLPHDPSINLVYDAMSYVPKIGKSGRLEGASLLALRCLASTALGIAVNGAIIYFMYIEPSLG